MIVSPALTVFSMMVSYVFRILLKLVQLTKMFIIFLTYFPKVSLPAEVYCPNCLRFGDMIKEDMRG